MTAMTLLDHLRHQGFTPDHDEMAERYDLDIGTGSPHDRRKVRVCPLDAEIIIYVMTGNGVVLWHARLTGSTPPDVITAVIDLAVTHAGEA